MAVLGVGGRLRLKREAPDPTVLRPGNVNTASNSIYVRNQAFWSGDEVTLTCANGLPIDASTNGPDCPNGYATYFGGTWYVGSNRSHIFDDTSSFYRASNTAQFYMRAEECALTTSANYFIYRDQLDRVSFYQNRSDALNGTTASRIQLFNVDFNALVISASGTTNYQTAIAECANSIGEYQFSDAQDEVSLNSICDFAPTYEAPEAWITEYDNAELTPRYYVNAGEVGANWVLQADLQEWSLSLSAPEVDTTSVGEKFGDAVKSLVNGGGSLDFLVDRRSPEASDDGTALMRLLILTEKGCKADAEFWMIEDRASSQCKNLLAGDLYYTTQILITSIAINLRPDAIIAGSANFVTVGEIGLRMGTN